MNANVRSSSAPARDLKDTRFTFQDSCYEYGPVMLEFYLFGALQSERYQGRNSRSDVGLAENETDRTRSSYISNIKLSEKLRATSPLCQSESGFSTSQDWDELGSYLYLESEMETPVAPAPVGTGIRGLDSSNLWNRRYDLLDQLHDLFTVVISLTDIVTDILVTVEFARKGHLIYFFLSLIIFVIAQMAYAFLFTMTWAKKRSNLFQCLVFLCALPFGQLIPVFAWIESFRISSLDTFLRSVGLHPTGVRDNEEMSDEDIELEGQKDSLWEYIQRKYTAHAGFLAEAFVEAIPQGILQTVAVITLSDTNALNLFSILMSISVIASKGYLVAYSIHRPSFAFNYVCIAADSFNLFATATWLFVTSNPLSPDAPITTRWWCYLALAGAICCVYLGFFILLFTIFDDHLKLRDKSLYPLFSVSSITFNVYLVRLLAWFLAIIPCSVVYCTAKLSAFPVLLFKSLDPEHASHSSFYLPLFQFLAGALGQNKGFLDPFRDLAFSFRTAAASICQPLTRQGSPSSSQQHTGFHSYLIEERPTLLTQRPSSVSCIEMNGPADANAKANLSSTGRSLLITRRRQMDLRLTTTNKFIAKSRLKQHTLALSLRPLRTPCSRQTALRTWLKVLDTSTKNSRSESTAQTNLAEKVLQIEADESNASQVRRAQRAATMSANAADSLGQTHGDVRDRSEVLRHLTGWKSLWKRLVKLRFKFDLLPFLAGLFSLVNVVIGGIIWAPLTFVFMLYSSVYVLMQYPRCVGDTEENVTLPCTLTSFYVACIFILILLSPSVYHFQLLRNDLVSLKGFPECYYTKPVILEVFHRFQLAEARVELTELLRRKAGKYNGLHILSYLDESSRGTCYK